MIQYSPVQRGNGEIYIAVLLNSIYDIQRSRDGVKHHGLCSEQLHGRAKPEGAALGTCASKGEIKAPG